MQETEDSLVLALHYRVIADTCLYCKRHPTRIRVTVVHKGGPFFAALCEEHAEGEMKSQTQDLHQCQGTSDFYHIGNVSQLMSRMTKMDPMEPEEFLGS